MLLCLECEVVLFVQIEELLPVAGRKIIPVADPHAETTFFRIAQRIYEGLDREIVPDCAALDSLLQKIAVNNMMANAPNNRR
jgi:hypothetical protein